MLMIISLNKDPEGTAEVSLRMAGIPTAEDVSAHSALNLSSQAQPVTLYSGGGSL